MSRLACNRATFRRNASCQAHSQSGRMAARTTARRCGHSRLPRESLYAPRIFIHLHPSHFIHRSFRHRPRSSSPETRKRPFYNGFAGSVPAYSISGECEVQDLGPKSGESCDYPDYAIPVAKAVASGAADQALAILRTFVATAADDDERHVRRRWKLERAQRLSDCSGLRGRRPRQPSRQQGEYHGSAHEVA